MFITYTIRGTSLSWSYGSWIYNYLCNQCQSPLMLWVRISTRARCTTLCDKVYQWLATGLWFSPGPPVSSTNKTDRHDITEILLKVALNTTKQTINQSIKQPIKLDKSPRPHSINTFDWYWNAIFNYFNVLQCTPLWTAYFFLNWPSYDFNIISILYKYVIVNSVMFNNTFNP